MHRIATLLSLVLACVGIWSTAEGQTRQRRNFYGMHNLKDGGVAIPEGMNWTRHLVGEGGWVFDWVRGDYGLWVVDAMDRGLIPVLRVQDCNGGCDPNDGHPAIVASVIRQHLETHRPEYLNRLIYFQIWNEPGDPRDRVTPARYAQHLVAAYGGVKNADPNGVFRVMSPGQNGPAWWEEAIRAVPGVCQAFDVWATHPYPESYPPHYNHHDGVPYINQVKTIDSYLLDLDVVARVCDEVGSPRRGFPVMITETIYGDHLGIAYEGYPKTTRGPACSPDGPCDFRIASQYNTDAFTKFWHNWPEIIAVHPFILNNLAWDAFAFVSKVSGSRASDPVPSWCPDHDPGAATPWPPGYSEGAQRCGLPSAPYPQYVAILESPKPAPALLEPYRGPVGSIRGTVRRSDNGGPVSYATLYTDGREFGGPSLFDGRYAVRDVPVGTYTLSVEKVGYGSASATVTVQQGAEAVVDFDLVFHGKVSKGIYFQNQGTCHDCNLFDQFLGQTVSVPADVGFIKFVAGMPNVSGTMKFSILEGGPTGAQLGASATAFLEWGGEMIGVEFPGDGVAVTPGGTYFIKMERDDGQGVYMFATNSDPYSGGMAYRGTTPLPGIDLFATVRGNTVAVTTATGTIEGWVEDASNQPLAGAMVTLAPGNHITTTAGDGSFQLSGLAEGVYEATASLAGYTSQTLTGIQVVENQTTSVVFNLERDVTTGDITGVVRDDSDKPLSGVSVTLDPGGQSTTSSASGAYELTGITAGTYTLRAQKTGYVEQEQTGVLVRAGATTQVDFALPLPPPPPPPPSNLIENGDFSQGLQGWSLWTERGNLNPNVNGSGALHLAAPSHNGGVYQSFSTGGAGTTIMVSGFWASEPTAAQAQWAEVLIINGTGLPQDGADLNENTPGVVLLYKNDTWASPGGWSGDMDQSAPAANVGSFDAAGDSATIVLKSGNLPNVSSGTLFDNIVVKGPGAPPPPPNQPPQAAASAQPTSGDAPLTVSFDGSASTDPDGDGLSFQWSFGDGGQASSESVSHTYGAAGTFTAGLTVDDGRGGTDTASLTITVRDPSPPPPPPVIDWDPRLDSLGVFLEEASVPIGNFYWKLVSATFESDGEIFPPPGGGSESQGTHAIYIKALDANGDPIEHQKAIASWPTGSPHTEVELFTKGPIDDYWGDFAMSGGNWCPFFPDGPRGPFGAYLGDEPSDRVWGMGMPCNRHVSFRLVWQWTAKGSGGPTPNAPPTASASATPLSGAAPLVVSFDGSASSDPDDDPLSYAWSFGDGENGTGAMVSHTYDQPGTYTASLTVDDGNGGSDGTTIFIQVQNPANNAPIAEASANVTGGVAPLTVSFDASGSWDPDGDPLTYDWDFGDGGQGSGVNPSHTYNDAGTFNAVVTVRDGRGGVDTAAVVITVTSTSSAKSKLTIHTGFGGPLSMAFIAEAKPRVVKILDSFSGAREIKAVSPQTTVIGRAFLARQPMDGDPIQRANEWWNLNANLILQNPDVDYWEGYNEPVIQTNELMDWYAQFEAERVRILAGQGKKAVIANFSVGNPDLPLWPAFYPAIDAALTHGGILGLHEYGTPMQQHFDFNTGEGWFAGRYRKLYRQFLIPEGKVIPLVITECGVDVVPPVGWKNHFTEAEYLDQLKWYDSVLLEDDYVLGATIFALEIPGWGDFDIAPIMDELTAYVASGTTPPPVPGQPDVIVESTSVVPPSPAPGDSVTFTAVVRNVGGASTPSGVPLGVAYFIDGTYTSYGITSSPLAAGASVMLTTQGGPWTATSGSHTLRALADDINRFEESNELNNDLSVGFEVGAGPTPGLPDVVVDSVAAVPAQPAPGQQVTFTSVVRNAGSAPTPAGVAIGLAYLLDGAYTTWGSVGGPLAPGASVTITTQGGSWTAVAGTYELIALADDVNRFEESNEQNNATSASFTVGASPPGLPDVVVDSVVAVPAQPSPGQQVTFTSVVRNVGSAPTPASVAIGVAYLLDGSYVTWGAVSDALAPGATVTITTQGGSWTAVSGTYELTALVDDVNRFAEANEQNNATSTTLTVGSSNPPPAGAGLFGMNIDPANPAGNPSPQALKDIGVRWVRIEGKSSPGLGFYDGVIASYRNAGLKVMLLLDYTTEPGKPASNAGDGEWSAYLGRFVPTVQAIAQHYGDGVDAWQIWNEPDLHRPGTGYDPGVPAHHFGAMLRDAVAAIRPHSSRPIVTAGLASGDPGYLAQARDAVGGLTVDAVAVHPYGQRAPDNWPNTQWGFGNMSDLFDRYLLFGLPLWITEIGTVDETNQAEYLGNVYRLAQDHYQGQVDRIFWFCWGDGMVPPFGLLDGSGNPKGSYWSYQAVAPPW